MTISYLSYGNSSSDSGYRTRIISELLLTAEKVDAILINFGNEIKPHIIQDRDNKKKIKVFSFKRHYFKPFFLFDLARFLSQGKRIILQKNVKIIHAQGLYSAFIAIIFKFFIARQIKIVFDVHGLVPQEYVWLEKGRRWGVSFLCLKIIERLCAAKSDYLICASKSLKRYFKKRYKVKKKIDVIPNISLFPRRDLNELNRVRADLRKQFNLEDSIVLLHIGSFLQWTDTKKTVEIFRKLREYFPKVFLLIVTYEEKGMISSFLLKNKIFAPEFLVTHVPHDEIHKFAPVGDLGLIIRDNSLINQVAFPTKFSEYLACGVPVLCSSSIKDIAHDVKKHGLGYVLTENELNAENLKHLANKRNLEKMRINCITYFAQEIVRVKMRLLRIYTELVPNIDL
jgi:glycosyltransferase involved in cell wall biosynthesis